MSTNPDFPLIPSDSRGFANTFTCRPFATFSTRSASGTARCTSDYARLIRRIVSSSDIGRARTFRWMDADYVDEKDPCGMEIAVMDTLGPGDVAVHSTD